MNYIIKYQKIIANETTYTLTEPNYNANEDRCVELCTINNDTYVSIPSSIILPKQPTQIKIIPITLTSDLKNQINKSSPHIRLINKRVVEEIRKKYSTDQEIKMLRISTGTSVDTYKSYVIACVAKGKLKKSLLGL